MGNISEYSPSIERVCPVCPNLEKNIMKSIEASDAKSKTEILEQEISDLSNEIGTLERRVERLNLELIPVRNAETEIKDRIRHTHGRASNGTVIYNPKGSEARKPLFDKLMEISIQLGPAKAHRAELAQRLRDYQKRVDVLTNELERWKKREARKKTKPMKALSQKQSEVLGNLLGDFGLDKIDHKTFWHMMDKQGFTQEHIDQWCAAYHGQAKQRD